MRTRPRRSRIPTNTRCAAAISADDILHDIFALALTRVGDGQGNLPYAQLIIASDNVDDFIRYALDACARLEASADFDTAAAQMVEDHELGQWAVDTLRAAPEGFSVNRLLTAESGWALCGDAQSAGTRFT